MRPIPPTIDQLKADESLSKLTETWQVKYLTTIIELDHCFIKRRIKPRLGGSSSHPARRPLKGSEAMHMIRKGQIKDIERGDVLGPISFINKIFGVTAEQGLEPQGSYLLIYLFATQPSREYI